MTQEYTLENFVVNRANEMAYKAAQLAIKEPTRHSPLVFCGKGTEKNQLTFALAKKFEEIRGISVLSVAVEDFIAE